MKYKKDDEFSYCLGATLAVEAINNNNIKIESVFYNAKTSDELINKFANICNQKNIKFELNNKIFNALSDKENCFIIAKFKKFENKIKNDNPHIVLVNPSNTGNLGTIIRSALGFNVKDIAIIRPAVDLFDPKTIRASMGAVFNARVQYFDSIEEYLQKFKTYKCYPFMLKAKHDLRDVNDIDLNHTALIFGNEATGLDDKFLNIGESVIIKHSKSIDSLNLQTAVSIALFHFTKDTKEFWKICLKLMQEIPFYAIIKI